jgi:serine/threonine-protein kinase
MPIDTVAGLVETLKKHRLLESARMQELTKELAPRFADPRALAKELLQRGWLTPFQLNRLFQGKVQELLLGSYVLLEPLGEGGMGTVYKARHQRLDRIDALKVIRKNLLTNPKAVERFQREARAAARLSHPNVITVYDANEAGDVHYLAMEYIPGIDLAKLVKQGGPLPPGQACDYIRQGALGLQHAHERGLVHRDIKPSNLLLTQDGSTVKLLDLGLARLQSASPEETTNHSLTETGAVVGTPDYIAPEQARNSREIDIRADIYSLGCSLYYLLTAKIPFPGETLTEKLIKHQLEEPEPLREVRPDVPANVVAVVQRMMNKRPEDRYQTPAHVADALAPLAVARARSPKLAEAIAAGAPLAGAAAFVSAPLAAPVDRSESTPGYSETRLGAQRFRKSAGAPRLLFGALAAAALLLFLTCGAVFAVFAWRDHGNAGGTDVAVVKPPPTEKPLPTVKLDPQQAKLHFERGNNLHKEGKYQQAVGEFTEALRFDSKHVGAWNNRGLCHKSLGDIDKAISDFTNAILYDNRNVDAYFNRAAAFYKKGDYARAIADNTQVITLDPRHAAAWNNLGTLHSLKRDFPRAILDFDEAIRIDRKYASAYANRGNAHIDNGALDLGIADLNEAIQLEAKNAGNYQSRGYAYYRKADYDQAIKDFSAAIERNPKLAGAYFYRGKAHEKKGNKAEAESDLRKAIELDPKLANVKQ